MSITQYANKENDMFNILKNLIQKHFYSNKAEAIAKVDVCFAMGKLTQDQYSTLIMLIDEHYPEEPNESEEQ